MVDTNKFDINVWNKSLKSDLNKWIIDKVINKSIPINKVICGTYIGTLYLGFQDAFYTTKRGGTGEVHNLSKKVMLGIIKEILCR